MKKPVIRIVKKRHREPSTNPLETPQPNSSSWSQSVRSWVTEFRKNEDQRSSITFNQVFSKQPLS